MCARCRPLDPVPRVLAYERPKARMSGPRHELTHRGNHLKTVQDARHRRLAPNLDQQWLLSKLGVPDGVALGVAGSTLSRAFFAKSANAQEPRHGRAVAKRDQNVLRLPPPTAEVSTLTSSRVSTRPQGNSRGEPSASILIESSFMTLPLSLSQRIWLARRAGRMTGCVSAV